MRRTALREEGDDDNASRGHSPRVLKIEKEGISVGLYRVCRNESLVGVG